MFGYLTLFSALSLATTAAWFAIAGIMAIFSGNPYPALVMGAVIELGKVVGVSWVYRNWDTKTKLKYPLLIGVIVAMLLTSMGIFGFLSKAHIEQNAEVGDNTLQIERLDSRIGREQDKISREQTKIDNAEAVIAQLDETIATLIEFDKISDPENGARAVRERQKPERDELSAIITEAQNNIDSYEDRIAEFQDERLVLGQELQALELEVGPVKYIAEIIYTDAENNLEDAVRIVIIMFIFVFDPMAILLLMAANHTLMRHQHLFDDEETEPTPPFRKVIPNAEVKFTPSEDTLNDRGSNQYADPECERLAEEREEREEQEREKASKAKSVEIPAEPREEEKEKEEGPRKHTVTRPHKFGG
jgi:hypothetical protein